MRKLVQGVAACARVAQAGSLPDIAEQSREMELRISFQTSEKLSPIARYKSPQKAPRLPSLVAVRKMNRKRGQVPARRHLQFTQENFLAHTHTCTLNYTLGDINGRLSFANKSPVSSEATVQAVLVGLSPSFIAVFLYKQQRHEDKLRACSLDKTLMSLFKLLWEGVSTTLIRLKLHINPPGNHTLPFLSKNSSVRPCAKAEC